MGTPTCGSWTSRAGRSAGSRSVPRSRGGRFSRRMGIGSATHRTRRAASGTSSSVDRTAQVMKRLCGPPPENENPLDWSPDGRPLLYIQQSAKTDYDVWALPIVGDRKPFPVAQTTFAEQDARFSPDGRWVAFESNESGRREIYVQPCPGPGV